MQLVIIADDLTGACDAATPFALRGIQTFVSPEADTEKRSHSNVFASLFGKEDELFLRPAVDQCRSFGIDCEWPAAPDTIFHRAAQGYDLIVAMLLGIPIIRTSVDHGTAFDIAGKNLAGESNMVSAMKMRQSAVAV